MLFIFYNKHFMKDIVENYNESEEEVGEEKSTDVAAAYLTHVAWKPGTRDFGAPIIKLSFFGPLYSPWKIINTDVFGNSNGRKLI